MRMGEVREGVRKVMEMYFLILPTIILSHDAELTDTRIHTNVHRLSLIQNMVC